MWDCFGKVWYVRATSSREAIQAVETFLHESIVMWEMAYGAINASHQVWEINKYGKLQAYEF